MLRLLLSALLVAVAAASANAPNPPTWPSQYYVKGTFSIPYFNISQPTEIWYDATNNRQVVSYYNGMDVYVFRYDLNQTYEVVPRIDQMVCFTQNGSGSLEQMLPDLSANWTYSGTKNINGVMCNTWQQVKQNLNKTNYYTFYLDVSDNTPVQLYLYGYDFVFGSHPDIYIMDFDSYVPSIENASVFDEPTICRTNTAQNPGVFYRARASLGQLMHTMNPPAINDEFDAFVWRHKKVYLTSEEKEMRRSQFYSHLRLIEEHNRRTDVTFKMGMNHFGDMTQEEIETLIHPRSKHEPTSVRAAVREHSRGTAPLPPSVDWVAKGAVNPPKDQGICGSCWTFGTVASIEGAWAIKTGKLPSLSEQQLVDCAWVNWAKETQNLGCDGGFAAPAMQWVIDNGGIATEAHYPYLMQDHWCSASDKSSGVVLTGYVNVTAYSEDALQDAIANHGPVAIAIDATYPYFTFYTSGVYYNPQCSDKIKDLDHEITCVGYGTENNQEYWLIKNSWSTHWGDMGFAKMARNRNNNCGVASQATFPLV
jgi:C1A family cysteine protease